MKSSTNPIMIKMWRRVGLKCRRNCSPSKRILLARKKERPSIMLKRYH
jgi:hypothetical protein